MSTITPNAPETSVMFSLSELAKLEEERVQEENVQRSRAREREARELREQEARRRAAEAARVDAEEEARVQRRREEAAEKVRMEARAQAAADVARIEAEAKARLEEENARRAHELEVLRVRAQGGHRRLQHALAALLGLVLCGGSAAAYGVSRHVEGLEQDAAQLREGQQALARERESAKTTELAALERRYAALRARPLARGAEEARVTAEAARNAVDAKSPDHDRLRAFADALDVLQARIETLAGIAALDRRQADLAAWAAERRRTELTAAARSAAARAKATGDDAALRAYEGALDQLRDALAQSSTGPGRPLQSQTVGVSQPCAPGDPGCGLNGEKVF